MKVYELKNGKRGRLLNDGTAKQSAKACMLNFSVMNDLVADTTYYLGASENGWVTLILKDENGHLISQQVTGFFQPIQNRFGQDEAYFLPVQLKAGQKADAEIRIEGAFSYAADPACYLYSPLGYYQYQQNKAVAQNTQENIRM